MRQRWIPFSIIVIALVSAAVLLASTLPGANVMMSVRYAELINKTPEDKIRIPIRGIRQNQIADTWQAPRGADRRHEGQDIFAPKGTPIYSATDGYIIKIGENQLGGKTVSVLGAGGRAYYYAHLDRYADNLLEGDAVSPDTILGYVGNTGNAAGTPPHLHFAVYTFSGPINPIGLF